MPYYLHEKSVTEDYEIVELGKAFDHVLEARKGIDPKTQTVTFIASEDESREWRNREVMRFDTSEYLPVPWYADKGNSFGCPYGYPEAVKHHFPHRSIKDPGRIAYTKNDEHGINDRQTVVNPGRYLEEFYKDFFDADQIADYINRCKAETLQLQIARSESDIVAIYSQKGCGFTSCMQFKRSPEYDWQRAVEDGNRKHPVAVYGDSDLGVAYLGSIETKITARCVVWPDKQLYARVYGDAALTALLRANGYHEGDMDGARVRYLRNHTGVIMPYIDKADGATVDGDWVVLGEGRLSTSNVTGYGDNGEDEGYAEDDSDAEGYCACDHCGDHYDYESQRNGDLNRTWCDNCIDRSSVCVECECRHWSASETTTNGEICRTCYQDGHVTCVASILQTRSSGSGDRAVGAGSSIPCAETWHELSEFTREEQAERMSLRVTSFCRTCAEYQQSCVHCDRLFSDLDTACPHCAMSVPCEKTLYLYTYANLQGEAVEVDDTKYYTHRSGSFGDQTAYITLRNDVATLVRVDGSRLENWGTAINIVSSWVTITREQAHSRVNAEETVF